jgi:hypothetical protein
MMKPLYGSRQHKTPEAKRLMGIFSDSPLRVLGAPFLQLHLLCAIVLLSHHPPAAHASTTNPSLAQECEINAGPCSKKSGDAQVLLDIQPKPVKAMGELTFTVTVKGMKDYESLKLDLKMPGMYMGTNEVTLVKTGAGRYTGRGIIPRCHSGKRLWSATVVMPGHNPPETSFLFNVLY